MLFGKLIDFLGLSIALQASKEALLELEQVEVAWCHQRAQAADNAQDLIAYLLVISMLQHKTCKGLFDHV